MMWEVQCDEGEIEDFVCEMPCKDGKGSLVTELPKSVPWDKSSLLRNVSCQIENGVIISVSIVNEGSVWIESDARLPGVSVNVEKSIIKARSPSIRELTDRNNYDRAMKIVTNG